MDVVLEDLLNMIVQGDLLGAVVTVYQSLIGNWFWALMAFTSLGLVYVKSGSVTLTLITAYFTAAVYITVLPPPVHSVAYFLIVLATAIVLLRAFLK